VRRKQQERRQWNGKQTDGCDKNESESKDKHQKPESCPVGVLGNEDHLGA